MKRSIWGVALAFSTAVVASAETSLWRVRSGTSTLYVGGTCHVLRASDYPLPAEFDKAYEASSRMVFETDLGAIDSPEAQQMIVQKGTYADGTTLEKTLSPEAFGVLKQYFDDQGMPITPFNQFKPSMVIVMIMGMELQKLGVTQVGVDLHYHGKAVVDKKPVEGLETIDEQVKTLMSMGEGNEDDFVTHSIEEIHELAQTLDDLIKFWKEGDVERLRDIFIEDLKEEYPHLYRTLFVERNMKWLPKIEAYLQTPEKEFVLVGAGHLIGEDGVIEHLKKSGYAVEKYDGSE